jgi:hypothetical protein
MLRAGLIILVMMMAGASSFAASDCSGRNDGPVIKKQSIRLDGKSFSVVLRKLPGANPHDSTLTISVFAGSKNRCAKPLFSESIEGGNDAHIDALNFRWFRGMDVVSTVGANAVTSHRILRTGGRRLIDVTPKEGLGSEDGGFFIGSLGKGRGMGLAVWGVDWSDGDDHWPRSYVGTLYRWHDSSFQKLEDVRPPEKFRGPGGFPAFMGWNVK